MGVTEQLAAAERNLAATKARIARLKRKAKDQKKRWVCRGCGVSIELETAGRPRVWCENCRRSEPYKRWFREKYGEKLREYHRLYRREYRKRQKALSEKAKHEAQN